VEQTRSHVVDDPDLELLATANRGMTLITLGDYAAADADLTSALRSAREHNRDLLALQCLSHLALSAAALGDAEGMHARAQQAIEFAAERGWAMTASMVPSYVIAGWGAWRLMDIATAHRMVALAAAIDADVEPPIALSVRVLDAYVTFARTGDRGRLVDKIRNAWANTVEELAAPMAVSHYCVQDLRTALTMGERGWADSTIERAHRLLNDATGDTAVLDAMMDAHHGRTVAARTKLAPLLRREKACHVVTTEIAAWLLEAQLAAANDEPAQAHSAVVHALDLAAPLRLIRDLATAPDLVRQLLVRGRGRFGPHEEFVGDLLAAANEASGAMSHLVAGEALTTREQELLRDLPSMLSLDEIARAHVVSINTVKSHLKALYRKLNATSRREAVARARELGLL
jgi:LuxR family maltose regulon positive regulatory protein